MTNITPVDPLAYQEWLHELEQKWQAGLIPDPQAVAVNRDKPSQGSIAPITRQQSQYRLRQLLDITWRSCGN